VEEGHAETINISLNRDNSLTLLFRCHESRGSI
jgi:hypothetical protein